VGDTPSAPQVLGKALVSDLDRKLAHVLEPAMRRRIVRDALIEAGAEATCAMLAEVERRPPGPQQTVQDRLREAIRDVLLGTDSECAIPYALHRDVYESACRSADADVMSILRSLPVREELEVVLLPRELSEIPLGRRRSLALGDDAQLLELLARDLDPVVIRHLLRNPRTRESEVIRIAARRPVAPSTLEEIFRSERWSQRPRVRAALARNPYCPTAIALRLVPALPLPELREMRNDPGMHEETHASVERELARRRGESSA
jgi:hypothetical protein